jgi:HEPN domain-containing protein
MQDEQAYDELARTWLLLASNDYRLAEIAVAEGLYPQACFLCQQVAEKALKAYLFARRQPLVRSHVLPRLRYLAEQLDPAFDQLDEACDTLTEYYIDTRYPDAAADLASFDAMAAEEALQLSELVLSFIRQRVDALVGRD